MNKYIDRVTEAMMGGPIMKYVIWSFEHNAWWGENRCGYVQDLDVAGRYSAEDAGKIVTNAVWLESVAVLESVARDMGEPKYHPYRGATLIYRPDETP